MRNNKSLPVFGRRPICLESGKMCIAEFIEEMINGSDKCDEVFGNIRQISENAAKSASVLYFAASTGHGASKIINWALEPNSSFPTFDRFFTPIMI